MWLYFLKRLLQGVFTVWFIATAIALPLDALRAQDSMVIVPDLPAWGRAFNARPTSHRLARSAQ